MINPVGMGIGGGLGTALGNVLQAPRQSVLSAIMSLTGGMPGSPAIPPPTPRQLSPWMGAMGSMAGTGPMNAIGGMPSVGPALSTAAMGMGAGNQASYFPPGPMDTPIGEGVPAGAGRQGSALPLLVGGGGGALLGSLLGGIPGAALGLAAGSGLAQMAANAYDPETYGAFDTEEVMRNFGAGDRLAGLAPLLGAAIDPLTYAGAFAGNAAQPMLARARMPEMAEMAAMPAAASGAAQEARLGGMVDAVRNARPPMPIGEPMGVEAGSLMGGLTPRNPLAEGSMAPWLEQLASANFGGDPRMYSNVAPQAMDQLRAMGVMFPGEGTAGALVSGRKLPPGVPVRGNKVMPMQQMPWEAASPDYGQAAADAIAQLRGMGGAPPGAIGPAIDNTIGAMRSMVGAAADDRAAALARMQLMNNANRLGMF